MHEPAPPTSVLVVDDEESICFALGLFLCDQGDVDVDAASGYAEALTRLDARRYDVLITDLHLSGRRVGEGLDLIRRAHGQSPETTVVLMTAHGTPEIAREAASYGCEIVLQKPFPLSVLVEILGERTKRSERTD